MSSDLTEVFDNIQNPELSRQGLQPRYKQGHS